MAIEEAPFEQQISEAADVLTQPVEVAVSIDTSAIDAVLPEVSLAIETAYLLEQKRLVYLL